MLWGSLIGSGIGLQQYLPFTVLKQAMITGDTTIVDALQQYLPFTVLKPTRITQIVKSCIKVATVLTVYGIETSL